MKKYQLLFLIFLLSLFFWQSLSIFQKGIFKSGIILATTTSLYDSGLLESLIEAFEKQSGSRVKIIAAGTGEALKIGQKGEADFLLVHAPELEEKFMANGYGLCRQELMFSRFVLVGPENDPAGIRSLTFPEAFSRIAQLKIPFISRADYSGTHFLERKIWEKAGLSPRGKWYLEIQQGMAEALMIAAEKRAYILADYPTYFRLKKRLGLEALTFDENYLNVYSAIIPRMTRQMGQEEQARKLWNFLLSPVAREIIISFGYESQEMQPLFYPYNLNSAAFRFEWRSNEFRDKFQENKLGFKPFTRCQNSPFPLIRQSRKGMNSNDSGNNLE